MCKRIVHLKDGVIVEEVLEHVEQLTGNIPKPPLKRDTDYQKRKKKHHRRRAAIEPIIGHLKADHRVARNFLKEKTGDSINFVIAASAFNFRKLMKKLKKTWLYIFIRLQN